MPKIIQPIMVHNGAEHTVARHLSIWERITKDIVFISPEDSQMQNSFLTTHYAKAGIGKAEHHGEISAQRIELIFEFLLSLKWDYCLLNEYDSFATNITRKGYAISGGLSAALYFQNKSIKFKRRFYLHYPMLFTKEAMSIVYFNMSKIKTNDRYFSDRFIGGAAEIGKVPINDLKRKKLAFSKNTIGEKHVGDLEKALRLGALFFHGVKTEHILQVIKSGIGV